MTWTSDQPTQTGFYWYRESSRDASSEKPYITVVEVVICEESFVAELAVEGDRDLSCFSGEWYGPLEIPQ
jgi:hypothetical protein